jgi:hypothetical protein
MAEVQGQGAQEGAMAAAIRRLTAWALANRSHWVRGLLMLAFFVVLSVLRILVGLLALFQLGVLLIMGEPNEPVRRFGGSLARYTQDVVAFLTCTSDQAPFPFREWPAQPSLEEGEGVSPSRADHDDG